MDSSNLRSWEGHLANTEKLSILIGWSKLRACSLMLLNGGFEKGMLVLGDIKLALFLSKFYNEEFLLWIYLF